MIAPSPRDLKAVRNVIDMLDKRRPQVFVEAVIMEVAMRETIDLGLNAFSGYTAEAGHGRRRICTFNPSMGLVTGAASSLATASLTGGTSGGSRHPLQAYTFKAWHSGPAIPFRGHAGVRVTEFWLKRPTNEYQC